MRKFYRYILFLFFLSNIIMAGDTSVLLDINNKKINFATLKGKWILVNFWASWCEPCINEIREFNKLSIKHKDTIKIFAVNYDELNQLQQIEAAKKNAILYQNILQSSAANLNLGDVDVVPTTYVFNPEGKLSAKLYGGQTVKTIEEAIEALEHSNEPRGQADNNTSKKGQLFYARNR